MYTINPDTENLNTYTPYQQEPEKAYYDMSPPAPVNNNINTPIIVENNDGNIDTKNGDENEVDNKQKRIIFIIILFSVHIIDLIMEFIFKYINLLSLIDDICIFLLIIVFCINYFALHNQNKCTRILFILLFILIWIGGFLCKLMTIKNIINLKEEENYRNYVIALLIIGHIILIAVRIVCLMIGFGGLK